MTPFRYSLSACSAALLLAAAISPGRSEEHLKHTNRVPTFAKDVAPILYSKCAPCHHAGEVAPFTLTSYEDAKRKASTLAAVAKQKYMPPWQAVSHGEFVNERTLTPAQIEILDDWAKAGAPKGDLSQAPKPPSYTPGWAMGTPDFIGKPSQPYSVAAEGADDYRCFVIPTNYPEGKYVTGIELRPGNRQVVHHVLIYLDKSGVARKKAGKDGKPGYASFGGPGFIPVGSLGGWAPGLQYQQLPAGKGLWLPPGADIVLQIHYHKNGKEESDLTQLGLQFAKGPIDKRVRWESVDNELITIAPGDSHYEVKADLVLPAAVTLLDVIPHMHLLGHDMTVTATLPDGAKRQLIHVEPYDFNWQTRYTYKEPIHLPKGTRLDMVAHYDNSAENPHNPNNPPKKVMFGEQTTNEMCFAFFSYTFDDEHIAKGVKIGDGEGMESGRRELTLNKIFDHFDADHDGKLNAAELADVVQFFESALDDPSKKPTDPNVAAKFLIAMYGKAEKGFLNRHEFAKMAKELK
jgi:hypothetical protein